MKTKIPKEKYITISVLTYIVFNNQRLKFCDIMYVISYDIICSTNRHKKSPDGQTDKDQREKNTQTNRQREKTDRQTDRDKKTDRQTNREKKTDGQTNREKKQTDKQIERKNRQTNR
jgi:hypothetical protein